MKRMRENHFEGSVNLCSQPESRTLETQVDLCSQPESQSESLESFPTGFENMDTGPPSAALGELPIASPLLKRQKSSIFNSPGENPVTPLGAGMLPPLTTTPSPVQQSQSLPESQDSLLSSKFVALAPESQDSLRAGNPLKLAQASAAVTRAMTLTLTTHLYYTFF